MKKILQKIYREGNVLIHRYLILSITAFFISNKLIFNDPNKLSDQSFYPAIAILIFIAFWFGKRGALQTCYIYIGFFISMASYKTDAFIDIFTKYYRENIFSTHYIGALICVTTLIILYVLHPKTDFENKKKIKQITRADLYPERQDTYDAISGYLRNHNVIAIDSPFGNGKSTIVQVLRNEKKNWEFITIGILSTTVENVEFCIIREINRILEKHGIFSNPINKIKAFFSHDFTYCIGDLLSNNQSYEDQIQNFVNDIHRLGKTIVLNFEDIDRITNKEHLNKIFSICDSLLKYDVEKTDEHLTESIEKTNEELTKELTKELKKKTTKEYKLELKEDPKNNLINDIEEKNGVKVIYQCNIELLNKIFKEEYGDHYIKKYIPYSVCLGKLSGDVFNDVLKQNPHKYEKIQNINFDFLDNDHELFEIYLAFSLKEYTIRDIEQVLDKINAAFTTKYRDFIQDENYTEIISIFYITMHFAPITYKALTAKKLPKQQKIFIPQGSTKPEERISLSNLYKQIQEDFINKGAILSSYFDDSKNNNADINREALLFLSLIGYNDAYLPYTNTEERNKMSPENRHEMLIYDRNQRIKNRVIRELLDIHST